MYIKKLALFVGLAGASFLAVNATANTVTYSTSSGATESGGNAVNATATFTTSANTLSISLTDNLSNPTTVAQLISDLDFVLSSGQTSGSISSSSGLQRTVNGDGTYTVGSTVSTGWGLNNNVAGGLQLDALGFIGPAGLVIGGPGAGNKYTAANSSIAGNSPHNPFLYGTINFTLTIAGLTANDTVSSAIFSFGTTAGDNVTSHASVPDGGTTAALLGGALTAAGLLRRKLSA